MKELLIDIVVWLAMGLALALVAAVVAFLGTVLYYKWKAKSWREAFRTAWTNAVDTWQALVEFLWKSF